MKPYEEYRKLMKNIGLQIKVMEKSGKTKSHMMNSDPFNRKMCTDIL